MVRGSPNPRYFGLPARLRKARKQSGLSRAALGPKVGRDSHVAADVEAGERMPTVATVALLASGLNVSAGWLGFGLGAQQFDAPAATTRDMKQRVQAMRTARGLTKAELARLIDLSPTALANIEKGAQTGVDVLEALAKALGISPAWLAYGEGPQVLPSRRRLRTTAASTEAVDLRQVGKFP